MAASSSKARARPILRDVSSSDESSNEILEDANTLPRQFSLLSPRMPRLHSIKGLFKLVLGGILVNPPRSRTRRTEFKFIERLPDQLQGQFKFYRDEGPVFRPGYPRDSWATPREHGGRCTARESTLALVFKLMPSTEDMSYTGEEFVQEFHTWLSLCEPDRPEGAPHHPVSQIHFHIPSLCESIWLPFHHADLQGLRPWKKLPTDLHWLLQ